MVIFLDGLLEHQCSKSIAAVWRVLRLAIGNVCAFWFSNARKILSMSCSAVLAWLILLWLSIELRSIVHSCVRIGSQSSSWLLCFQRSRGRSPAWRCWWCSFNCFFEIITEANSVPPATRRSKSSSWWLYPISPGHGMSIPWARMGLADCGLFVEIAIVHSWGRLVPLRKSAWLVSSKVRRNEPRLRICSRPCNGPWLNWRAFKSGETGWNSSFRSAQLWNDASKTFTEYCFRWL